MKKLLLIVVLFCVLAGCDSNKKFDEVEIKYVFNKELIYSYRAYAEYDNIRFWGSSSESYDEAKEEVIKKINKYIKGGKSKRKPEIIQIETPEEK